MFVNQSSLSSLRFRRVQLKQIKGFRIMRTSFTLITYKDLCKENRRRWRRMRECNRNRWRLSHSLFCRSILRRRISSVILTRNQNRITTTIWFSKCIRREPGIQMWAARPCTTSNLMMYLIHCQPWWSRSIRSGWKRKSITISSCPTCRKSWRCQMMNRTCCPVQSQNRLMLAANMDILARIANNEVHGGYLLKS